MSTSERDIESEVMPDWAGWEMDELDRIDWQPIAELGKAREWAPGAALAENA